MDQDRIDQIQLRCRVPVLPALVPGTDFVVVLSRYSEDPEPDELAQIASYQKYVVRRFYPGEAETILARAFPWAPGHNTLFLVKGTPPGLPPRRGWRYAYASAADELEPSKGKFLALFQLLDLLRTGDDAEWTAWKASHSDVFPPAEAPCSVCGRVCGVLRPGWGQRKYKNNGTRLAMSRHVDPTHEWCPGSNEPVVWRVA